MKVLTFERHVSHIFGFYSRQLFSPGFKPTPCFVGAYAFFGVLRPYFFRVHTLGLFGLYLRFFVAIP